MFFVDTIFILLFAIVFLLATVLRQFPVTREWIITAFSALFFASWGRFDLGLFVVMLLVNYAAVMGMARTGRGLSRAILAIAIGFDLLALAIFKYANFIGYNATILTGWTVPAFSLGIPLAISFYTFHLISYLVDAQAGRVSDTTFRRYLFYLSFFPHVVAGPIVRPWQLIPQIGVVRRIRGDFAVGFHYMVTGFLLKSIAADNIGMGIDPIWQSQGSASLSAADSWCVAFLYYCQIYGDFAGYSLMALGMARLLGYRLPANFRSPMLASSLQEFWRRWHITLSRWLRDYLYIPLGGSRVSNLRTYVNLVLTMLLGGLWHGAGWGFVVWGAMHGIGLAAERWIGFNRLAGGARWAWWLLTQAWVTTAWAFFRSNDLSSGMTYVAKMMRVWPAGALHIQGPILSLMIFTVPVILHHAAPFLMRRLGHRNLAPALGLATGVMLVLDLVVYSPNTVFLYFKF